MTTIHTHEARDRLTAGLPTSERRLDLAGISTPLLEGGDGPPMVLLHGPGANATHWMRVIGDLVTTHRVIAPDLPGQGASEVDGDGPLDADRVFAWLGELIDQTCSSPPVLVGYALGGAIAARFAASAGARIDRLVLVDTLGLEPFAPAPDFGAALHAFLAEPTGQTHDGLWRHCALDLDRLREQMEDDWTAFKAYNVDRAQTQSVQAAIGALVEHFAMPAIPAADLEQIAAPTTLIWGRHDLATPLSVAQSAADRHGWPLHVIGYDPRCARASARRRTARRSGARCPDRP